MSRFKEGDVICRFVYESDSKIRYRQVLKIQDNMYFFSGDFWLDGNYVDDLYMLKEDFKKKYPEAFI